MRTVLCCIIGSVTLAASLAHGEPVVAESNSVIIESNGVYFDPGDATRIFLSSSIGFLLSEDGGERFEWVCRDAVGYPERGRPDFAVDFDGDIFVPALDGLRVSSDGGCVFEKVELFDGSSGMTVPLDQVWVGDVEVGPDGRVWAVSSSSTGNNRLFVSLDGHRFDSVALQDEEAIWRSVRIAPGDANRVYVSGHVFAKTDENGQIVEPARAKLFRSDDGGASFVELAVDDFELGAQADLRLLGVSPADASIVFARVVGASDPSRDDVYRSTDGGTSWQLVLHLGDTLTAFVIRPGGDEVIVGTVNPCLDDPIDVLKGCVWISDAGGATESFRKAASQPRMNCLGESTGGSLYACGANGDPDRFALGVSADGETWSTVFRFAELAGPRQCPNSPEQIECVETVWPDLCLQLGVCSAGDAGVSDGSVIVTNPAPDRGCWGCRSSQGGGPLTAIVLISVLLCCHKRRRRVKGASPIH